MKYNCPNCGAPIVGARCEFCGTVFYDFTNFEIGTKCYLRIKVGDTVHVFDAIPEFFKLEASKQDETLWANGEIYAIFPTTEYEAEIKFRVVPDKNGVLHTKLKRKKIGG